MSMKKYLLFFALFAVGCTSDTSSVEEDTISNVPVEQPSQPVSPEVAPPAIPARLITNLDNLRLRATPGEKGKEISRLPKGSVVTDMGEISDFTTRIRLRGVQFDEPWIKVKTESGQEGWLYGGAVNFSMDHPTALTNKLMERRLQTLFKGLTPEILAYQRAYAQAKNSETFTQVFRQGSELRDTLVTMLEDKIRISDYKQLPDLFWLEQAMPGYVSQLVAEGTLYYLFQDYQKLGKKAQQTQGLDDDNFFDLCTMVHAFDSVEHFFPAWFLQTWDYGGNSLLGQGVHLRILQKMETLHANGNDFDQEIAAIKEDWLYDITWNENAYWEPLDNIKKELDEILAEEWSILDAADRTALETRRKMFDDIKGNKIQVNLKNG